MKPVILSILKTRTLILLGLLAIIFLASCAKGITPYEAANGKAKCGKYIR